MLATAKYCGENHILSQSDFTGGCGISPHRLLGLLDSFAISDITTGWVYPIQRTIILLLKIYIK